MRNWLIPAFLIVLACSDCVAGGGPRFRHTNYIAFVVETGKTVDIHLTSIQIGKYGDPLQYRILNAKSEEVEAGEVGIGDSASIKLVPKQAGLHVIELNSGWNAVTSRLSIPHAIVCHEGVILKTVRGFGPLYFYVPTGTKRFTIHLQAGVKGEGLAYKICDPDGNVVSEGQGDYDRFAKVKVPVPPGADGKAWSLSILKPTQSGIALDDTEIYLGKALAPYLAEKAEWAVTFGKRKHP